MSKRWLPAVVMAVALCAVVVVALFLGGATGDGNLTPKNNINDASVNWSKYKKQSIVLSGSGETVIRQAGVYVLSGKLEDGYVTVDVKGGMVKLMLNNVAIKNQSGPAIYVKNARMAVIETVDGSENVLEDGANYRGWNEDVRGTLFSHDDLVLCGGGTLKVIGNYEDGIVGKDNLKVVSGKYMIDSRDEGLRGRDSVYIAGGEFEIKAGGDAIKANNVEAVSKGWVKIDGGFIVASAGDDGVHAESLLEINGGKVEITKSYEGMEGARITINGGEIVIASSDDGINAAGGNDKSSPNMQNYLANSTNYAVVINGGRLYINADGDGIDSNGSLDINGGEVVIDGPTGNNNGALDADTGVTYNGGTVIAVGSSKMAVAPELNSKKYSISVFLQQTYAAGTKITVRDGGGNDILTHVSAKRFQHAVLASESFVEGAVYYVYVNDEESAAVTLYGKTTKVELSETSE